MTLRIKTLLIIGVLIIGVIMALYVIVRIVLLGSFSGLEEQYVQENLQRAMLAISADLSALEATSGDWAAWDETYAFVEDVNEDYIVDNLGDSTFVNLRLNVMLFVHSSGQVSFGKALDLIHEVEVSVPQSLLSYVAADDVLLRHPDTDSRITGIVSLPEGPLLVASHPILTNDYAGPIRGSVVMGRYLDEAEIERFAESTHLSWKVQRLDAVQMPDDFQKAKDALSDAAPTLIQALDLQTIAGYALLEDIGGNPVLILRVDMPREIYRQGRVTTFYFVLLFLAVCLVFGSTMMLLLERQVLSRVILLDKMVSRARVRRDLSVRVPVAGRDELSNLAKDINSLLETREQSEARLQELGDNLAHQVRFLESMAIVARDATSVLDEQELLSRVVRLMSEQFNFYHTAVFLLDSTGEWAELRAASSEGGQRMLTRGYRLQVGVEGLVGYVTEHGEPRVALDAESESLYSVTPDLPDTRSEMTLPLQVRGKIIGALDVHSMEPGAFSQEDVAVFLILADQVAMAISNAALFERVQENLEAAQQAFAESSRKGWSEFLRTRTGLTEKYDPQGILLADDQWRDEVEEALRQGSTVLGETKASETLTTPIALRGQAIGALNAHKPSGDTWTQEEIEVLQTLTEQLAIALESARLYEDTQRRATRERLLREVTARIRGSSNPEAVLNVLLREVGNVLGRATFVRLGSAEQLSQVAAPSAAADDDHANEALPEDEPSAGEGGR